MPIAARSHRAFRAAVGRRVLRLEDRINPAALLPDLQVLGSWLNDWTVNTTTGGGREIRFTTGVANGGAGAFEINGTSTIVINADGSQSQIVNQRVYQSGGGFVDQAAGTFTYHPAHGHVHFDDFAITTLRQRPANQSVGAIVVSGPKTSFALLDMLRYDPSLPGSPVDAVYNTATNAKQGISVGWNDVYGSSLEGQAIDITGVPNGDYWLEVTVDPSNHIQETNESNNTTRVAITLTGSPTTGFRILSASPAGAVNNSLGSVTVNFNNTVNAGTFQSTDFVLNGPSGVIAATNVTSLTATQFRVDFPLQSTVGTYTMTIGPNISSTGGAVLDQNNNGTGGEASDQYTNVFVITAPHLDTATPTGTVYVSAAAVHLTYNKPISSATFTTADIFSFTGPGGVDLKSQISGVVPAASGGASALFDVNFTTQTTPGVYTMVIEPNLLDLSGNSVDQNLDGVTNNADRFTMTFTIQLVGTSAVDPFGYSAAPANAQNLELVGKAGAFTILNTGDDSAAVVDLGKNSFNLYGQSYTGTNQLFVSTNGLITFGAPRTEYNNDDFSNSPLASIAPLWDDWSPAGVTPMLLGYFEDADNNGTPERLIIEWNQVQHHPSTPSTLTWQTALQLNTGATPGTILFNYQDIVAGNSAYDYGGTATVGIRAAGTSAKSIISQDNPNTPLVRYSPAISISVPTVTSITRLDPQNISAGDAEFQVTFSRGVTGVDESDFSLTTTGGITGATIEHIHSTSDPAVWTVHTNSGVGSGTLRLNLVDNDSIHDLFTAPLGGLGTGNGGFTNGELYSVAQPPPLIMGTTIGDGTAQRSMITSITVVFNSVVTLPANKASAFSLTNAGGPVTFSVDTSASPPSNTVARLTFNGGSLADGDYTFQVLGSQISTGGVLLDGDNNGSPGGNSTTTFRRRFGDSNGDGLVNQTDFNAYRLVYGLTSTTFDFDRDNDVDLLDYNQFRLRFGLT